MNSKLSPLLQLVNLVAMLATLGFMVYSMLMFKRPQITEEGEKAKLASLLSSDKPVETVSGFVPFGPVTINIQSTPKSPKAAPGTGRQIEGKLHYATVAFSLELRDKNEQDKLETIRPLILDQLGIMMGKRPFHELTSVQGRYILASELVTAVNQVITEHAGGAGTQEGGTALKDPWVTHIYFTEFLVQ